MREVKTFSMGGVDAPDCKALSRSSPIVNAPVPGLALIPMLQHAGAPAEPLVKPGDEVREGMLIGRARGDRSANVHSPVPGRVCDVRKVTTPSGHSCEAIAIELGGEFGRSGRVPAARDWRQLSPVDLLEAIRNAGIVGMGGSGLPTHIKLSRRQTSLLVANGAECDPYATADHALMREKPREIIAGIHIARRLSGAPRTVLAIGERSADLVPVLEEALREGEGIEIALLSSRYPQGEESRVLSALQEGPAKAASDRGGDSLVLNVATLYAIYEAVVFQKPLMDRVVTVTGPVVRSPSNLKARIGTPIRELIEECGGFTAQPGRVILGSVMNGFVADSLEIPVSKCLRAVIALAPDKAGPSRQWPCIRCGRCIDVCPWGLAPARLYRLIDSGDAAGAAREGLSECTECGSCSYVCPSRIPLVEMLRQARREGDLA